jgi:uncharacterized protein YecE (DUF72 family)
MSLNQNFAIGLAIWGYKQWVGDLFPAKTRAQHFLNCYANRFSIVEGNTTFYAIPSPETVDRWRLETEPGFQFFPKLPKTLTHQGRLMPYLPQAFQFLDLMQGLGDRLGGLFLQLPPSYSPANFADLDLFLSSWRSATRVPLFLEVRHLQWFDTRQADRLNQRLTEHAIDRVLLDTRPVYNISVNASTNTNHYADDNPQQYSANKKPNVPVQPIVTSNTAFVRYISHPNRDRNTEYFNAWVEQVRVWLHNGKTVYFFVHCPLEENSPQNARYFQELLEQANVPVPPLPWNSLLRNTLPIEDLTQLGLFEP